VAEAGETLEGLVEGGFQAVSEMGTAKVILRRAQDDFCQSHRCKVDDGQILGR
jgi:hypothetical protein